MVVAVASGKGGTGKTTVSVNLARVIGSPVQILDCDVEEPNAQLFLGGRLTQSRPVVTLIPEVDDARCDGCGDCARLCQFNAIVSFGTAPLVFPELCHSCGGCARVCPTGAIREVERRIGVLETYEADDITLIQGIMDVGVAMAPPLIREVKAAGREGVPAILDAPPGTSCPVIATIRGADCVVLVTEPTPFGLHDLALAVEEVYSFLTSRTAPGQQLRLSCRYAGYYAEVVCRFQRGGLPVEAFNITATVSSND